MASLAQVHSALSQIVVDYDIQVSPRIISSMAYSVDLNKPFNEAAYRQFINSWVFTLHAKSVAIKASTPDLWQRLYQCYATSAQIINAAKPARAVDGGVGFFETMLSDPLQFGSFSEIDFTIPQAVTIVNYIKSGAAPADNIAGTSSQSPADNTAHTAPVTGTTPAPAPAANPAPATDPEPVADDTPADASEDIEDTSTKAADPVPEAESAKRPKYSSTTMKVSYNKKFIDVLPENLGINDKITASKIGAGQVDATMIKILKQKLVQDYGLDIGSTSAVIDALLVAVMHVDDFDGVTLSTEMTTVVDAIRHMLGGDSSEDKINARLEAIENSLKYNFRDIHHDHGVLYAELLSNSRINSALLVDRAGIDGWHLPVGQHVSSVTAPSIYSEVVDQFHQMIKEDVTSEIRAQKDKDSRSTNFHKNNSKPGSIVEL